MSYHICIVVCKWHSLMEPMNIIFHQIRNWENWQEVLYVFDQQSPAHHLCMNCSYHTKNIFCRWMKSMFFHALFYNWNATKNTIRAFFLFFCWRFGPAGFHHGGGFKHTWCHRLPKVISRSWLDESRPRFCVRRGAEVLPHFSQVASRDRRTTR